MNGLAIASKRRCRRRGSQVPLPAGWRRASIASSGWAWQGFYRACRRCLVVAVALAVMLPAATAAAAEGRFDDLLRGFVEAALRGEDGRPVALRRWEGPLRLRLVDEESNAIGPVVVAELRRLAAIAGLTIEVLPTQGGGAENLLIVLEGGSGYRVNGRDAGCYTRVKSDPRGALTRAEVRINIRHAGRDGACAAHELMHALGFLGHPAQLRSVLNVVQGIVAATEEDAILLRLLYAPGLELGQPEPDTMARIRNLLAQELDAYAPPPSGPSGDRGR